MVLDLLVEWTVSAIAASGYLGIFLLMLLESALIPIPSEVVMPFSGYLVYLGKFGFWEAVLAGTLGNLAGSLIAYWFGLKGGRFLIVKIHKHYSAGHLSTAENWFKRYGDITAFFSRLLPAVRTFISFPAGIGRMELKRFSFYTFAGSFIWSTLLTYSGVLLGPNWENLMEIFRQFEIAIIVGGLLIALYWFKFREGR